MSELEKYFIVGDYIEVFSSEHGVIRGEVENFDTKSGLLVLKNTSKVTKYGNFCVLDLMYSDMAYLRSVNGIKTTKDINLCLLVPEEENKLEYKIRRGSSPRGVLLFKSLKRLIDDVNWRGANILVLHEVVVSPPYDLNSITGNGKCITFVRRLIQNILLSEEKKTKKK